MGWNDRGGNFPASERRVYAARGALLELAQKHTAECLRIGGSGGCDGDVEAMTFHAMAAWKLLLDIGLENLEVKVDG